MQHLNKFIIILTLIRFATTAPQLFHVEEAYSLNYTPQENDFYPTRNTDQDLYTKQPNYPPTWFASNLPVWKVQPDGYTSDVFLKTSVPPVYDESEFKPHSQEIDFSAYSPEELERGRSDIDPEEDNDNGGGYYYPKPAIPFELPNFKPLVGQDEDKIEEGEIEMKTATAMTEEPATTENLTTVDTTEPRMATSTNVS